MSKANGNSSFSIPSGTVSSPKSLVIHGPSSPNENLNLETASEYLLMATWLAYLKSKLLLPEDTEDDFKASEVAEKIKTFILEQ